MIAIFDWSDILYPVIYCIQFIVSRVSTGAQEKAGPFPPVPDERGVVIRTKSRSLRCLCCIPLLHGAPLSMQLCMKEVFL